MGKLLFCKTDGTGRFALHAKNLDISDLRRVLAQDAMLEFVVAPRTDPGAKEAKIIVMTDLAKTTTTARIKNSIFFVSVVSVVCEQTIRCVGDSRTLLSAEFEDFPTNL